MDDSSAKMCDEALVDAYYSCDDQSFEDLYHRFFQALVAFFQRFVSREDAEDLAEDTFLRVVNTKLTETGRFDRTRSVFRVWLFSIAANVRRDHWRRQSSRPHLESEPPEDTPISEQFVSDEAGPSEALANEEYTEGVRDCLGSLTASNREVLQLDLRGFTLREIAEILGITYGTAGRRLHVARKQIRSCLEDRGFRWAPRGAELPPGTRIVMTFPDELLVQFDESQLVREGYRFVPVGSEVPQMARVVLTFPDVVLVKMGDPH